ncbi:MAG TPA: CrcB family protein [Solirubrobacterales bacterium]
MASDRIDPKRLAAIYLGGVLGALARVGLAEAAPHGAGSWPWATFAANMAGALLLGLLVAAMRGHAAESPRFALLTTGLCGTLTTFATLQLELYEMLDTGHLALAASYAAISIAVGLALVKLGAAAARRGVLLGHMTRKSPHGRDG